MSPARTDLIVDGEFYQRTKFLANYVLKKHHNQTQRSDKIGDKLYELCIDIKYKHDMFFENVGRELGLNQENFNELSKAVMSEVLNGNCNFGRIVSIFAFSLALSDYCARNNLGDKSESITTNVALSIQTHIDWFNINGQWDGFMDHFVPQPVEDKIWRGMMITTVGLGAVAGLLYAHS